MVTPPPLSPLDLPSHRRRPSGDDADSSASDTSSSSGSEEAKVEQFFDPIDEPEVHIQASTVTDIGEDQSDENNRHVKGPVLETPISSESTTLPDSQPPSIEVTGTQLGTLSLAEQHESKELSSVSSLAIVASGQQEEEATTNELGGARKASTLSIPGRSDHLTVGTTPVSSLHPLSVLASQARNGEIASGTEDSHPCTSSDDEESRTTITTTTTMSRTLSTSSAGPRSIILPTSLTGGEPMLRSVRVKTKKKGITEFGHLYLVQELKRTPGLGSQTAAPIYAARFSPDGNYLAMAGEDGVITVWKLLVDDTMALMAEDNNYVPPRLAAVFQQEPIQLLYGHEGAILDISWSRNNFLLSASMDRTVRLWHHSRDDCLGVFKHPDFVTSVAFHPRDDRLFITGSLDCRLRLWSIADKVVRAWNELPPNNFVTAVAFNASGKLALAGTSTGVCLVFETEGFNYSTQVHVHSRRGKNRTGKKICSIEAMPGNAGEEKILISTNDSRVRLYTLRDKSLISKFVGHKNESSQMRATFSDDGEYVISGSEDARIVVWNTEPRYQRRAPFWKRGSSEQVRACEWWKAHSRAVTVAIFAPSSVKNRLQSVGLRPILAAGTDGDSLGAMAEGAIIVAADLNGKVKVYENNLLLETWLKG